MGFEVTFSNVLLTLLYIIPGYIVAKMGKASADHLSTVSVILVYICSPYASTPMVSVNENIATARKYSRFAVERHCIPVTPHLLFPQFLDDCDKQEQQLAAFMGMVLLNHCQELWVFGDRISKGMKQEIQRARLKGKRIRWFTADLREKYFTGIKEAHI